MRFMATSLDEVVVGRSAAADEQQAVGPCRADELVDHLRRDDDAMIHRPRRHMTISELKRTMDRRFDRLERTKVDKVEFQRAIT